MVLTPFFFYSVRISSSRQLIIDQISFLWNQKNFNFIFCLIHSQVPKFIPSYQVSQVLSQFFHQVLYKVHTQVWSHPLSGSSLVVCPIFQFHHWMFFLNIGTQVLYLLLFIHLSLENWGEDRNNIPNLFVFF